MRVTVGKPIDISILRIGAGTWLSARQWNATCSAGTTEVHDYGRGRMTSEPVFARKPGAAAEHEGWILSYVYNPKRNLSDVVILNAQDFAGEPVATIRLPVRVPFGFHGGWAPDKVTVVE